MIIFYNYFIFYHFIMLSIILIYYHFIKLLLILIYDHFIMLLIFYHYIMLIYYHFIMLLIILLIKWPDPGAEIKISCLFNFSKTLYFIFRP